MNKSNKILFPVALTLSSLLILTITFLILIYSQFKMSQLISNVLRTDIPAIQASLASIRVISDVRKEFLQGASGSIDPKKIEAANESLQKFKQLYPSANINTITQETSITELEKTKSDAQLIIENLIIEKGKLGENQVVVMNIAFMSSVVGLIIFIVLFFSIHSKYQSNFRALTAVEEDLEKERMSLIQSSKLASLGEITAGLAHEINNPLSVIIGRIEIILSKINDGSAKDMDISKTFSIIGDMAFRISKIVQSMRKISKKNTVKGDEQQLTDINIHATIEEILVLYAEKFRTNAVTINIDEIDSSTYIHADYVQLSQVCINLLNNSVDELKKQPEENRIIKITSETKDGFGLIKIQDSGSGIPANLREKLFQPFFTTKEVGKGTGLGLSISKGLATSMGGDLYLSDTKETCFIISLPLGKS